MTPSAIKARGGKRQATRSRDDIIQALRRYAEAYGEASATAAAFSPSTAKWRDEPDAITRYYQGDPLTGDPWPSLNAIKGHFGGSFNAARVAAGLPANRPGPRGRKRADHTAAPIRGVSHVGATRTVYVDRADGEALEASRRKVARLQAKVARLEARPETKPVTVTRRVVDETAVTQVRGRLAKVEAKLLDAEQALALARGSRREARMSATRAASKLERAEATISELRSERRELKAALGRTEDRQAAAERERHAAEQKLAASRARVVVRDAPEQHAIDEALTEAREARRDAHQAELRAARADREYMVLASAVKGQERRLTASEVRDLASSGPSGPAVLAAALKTLAKARAGGTAAELQAALRAVAAAAVSWSERIH